MSSLKVIFLPWWSTNPYHQLLAKHLGTLGVEVENFSHSSISFLNFQVMRYAPNIIHFHSLHPFFCYSHKLTLPLKFLIFFCQILFAKLLGIRFVWTIHELKNHEKVQTGAEQIFSICFAHCVNAIFTHGEVAKQEVMQKLHLRNGNKIYVIPHGNYINYYENQQNRAEARKSFGIPESDTLFLFLGLIRPYKGVLELIAAFKQLSERELHLAIVGKPSTEELYRQIRQKVAGYENIKFIPRFVADNEVQIYMNAADVVVLPYRDILTSGSVILAMSFGCACVAPCIGFLGEVLDRSGAFLYSPSDKDGLLSAMKCAVQHRTQLQRMGQYNRQVVEKWNWEQVATITLKVYQQC